VFSRNTGFNVTQNGKYSDPLKFFTVCYFAANLLKSFKLVFPLIIVHTASHIAEKHRIVDIFAHLLKKKN